MGSLSSFSGFRGPWIASFPSQPLHILLCCSPPTHCSVFPVFMKNQAFLSLTQRAENFPTSLLCLGKGGSFFLKSSVWKLEARMMLSGLLSPISLLDEQPRVLGKNPYQNSEYGACGHVAMRSLTSCNPWSKPCTLQASVSCWWNAREGPCELPAMVCCCSEILCFI